ncbi:TetR/AcrR family transcriptional regulator [Georgenia halophila]|uniref:TetR/AcrR family transcriptional regulator n=1 Tax=Georgenia halophila TaxID=620889 RepID=A0ABP8KVC7_9MICO
MEQQHRTGSDARRSGSDTSAPQRRRQARGLRRMNEILDAAAHVFARDGYEAATTNGIAAEAGISPGSLYRYFRNKEEIATALVTEYSERLRAAHDAAFGMSDVATLPAEEVVGRVVDPILAFDAENPGFRALHGRPDMPAGLSDAVRPVQEAMLERVSALLDARNPGRPATELDRVAQMMIRTFQATMPAIAAADPAERPAVVAELEAMLGAYLTAFEKR